MIAPIDDVKNRIHKALTLRQMSPAELSEKTGISKSSISQYMSGYAKPKNDRIYLIAKALNVNEAWIMGFDAPMDRDRENSVLSKYQKLNGLGQQKADAYIDDLLDNPKYRHQDPADLALEKALKRQESPGYYEIAAQGGRGVEARKSKIDDEEFEKILRKHDD